MGADLRADIVEGIECSQMGKRPRCDGAEKPCEYRRSSGQPVPQQQPRIPCSVEEKQQGMVHHHIGDKGAQGTQHTEQRGQRQMQPVSSRQFQQVRHARFYFCFVFHVVSFICRHRPCSATQTAQRIDACSMQSLTASRIPSLVNVADDMASTFHVCASTIRDGSSSIARSEI